MLTQVNVMGCLYETIKSIAIYLEENSQLMPNREGNVPYPSSQDEHIQWLVERLDANPNIVVEFLHC